MNLFLFILATIGLSQIIVDGIALNKAKTLFKTLCKYLFNLESNEKFWICFSLLIALRILYVLEIHSLSYYLILMLLLILWTKFETLVDCYLCTGMWCGFLMGSIFLDNNFLHIFGYGCIGAFTSNITAICIALIESITLKNVKD